MNFYLENNISDFFDISVILPFYKKLKEFKTVFPKNVKYFQRNAIELIIVLDTPDQEQELTAYIDSFPFLNSKIIVNRIQHAWRNPAKALNVGVRNASRKYVFVASPETEFLTDVIYQLRYILHYHPKSYAVGKVCFQDINTSLLRNDVFNYELLPYGNFMVEKKYLEEIRGYSERLTSCCGADDNLRARLQLLGLKKMFLSQAIAIHREQNCNGRKTNYKRNTEMSIEEFKKIYYPQQPIENDNNWGTDFDEIAYDWTFRESNGKQCKEYIKKFKTFWIRDEEIFKHAYKIIALIQIKNEIRHIPEALRHLDDYCDGIILLDDGSVDGSYEAALSEKLLLKVQKEGDNFFNDLSLRNITIELAAFFKTEWLFFFDADERFDPRYADLYSIADLKDVDSVCFTLVHLWDNEYSYKINLPEKNNNGLLKRLRMFRRYGVDKITSNRIVHFPAVPFQRNKTDAPILIKHYGNIDSATRRMKYERYIKQDKEGLTQGYTFEYLIEDNSVLKDVNTLTL